MKLQLSLRATKLKNVAGAFKGTSDPFAVVSLLSDDRNSNPVIVGKTEVIKNCLNPDWVQTFTLDYELGTPIRIAISVLDFIRKGENKAMGCAIFDVGTILGSKGNTKAQQLKKGGVLYARIEKAVGKGSLELKLSGKKLKNKEGIFGTSDPFYELARKDVGRRGTEWNVVYRSDVMKNNLNPCWKEDSIELAMLCGDNLDLPIQCSVWDWEKSGKHKDMGHFETTVNGLVKAQRSSGLMLQSRKKEVGKIVVHKAQVVDMYPQQLTSQQKSLPLPHSSPTRSLASLCFQSSLNLNSQPKPIYSPSRNASTAKWTPPTTPQFIDYIHGGCEINLSVGIDFTGSNGNPINPGTLHYQYKDGRKNNYEKVIVAVGEILVKYDTDKKIPVWGFGAKYQGTIRHSFQCGHQPEVDGVQGILSAYRQTFQSGLTMSGPTDICEVLTIAAAYAKSRQEEARSQNKQAYSILLLLTDGAVTDIQKTANTIRSISDAPLSVVVVGIGNSDFTNMQFLDDLNDNSNMPDIVQFVEFNRHQQDKHSLTSATLEEIPQQLVGYFIRYGIQPLPPVNVEEEEIVVDPVEEEFDLSIEMEKEGDIGVSNAGGYVPTRAY